MAELPASIGKYKIESLVAKGGMGAVLKALHPTLRRHVVLKKLTIRGSAAIAERFKREARILIDLRHDNIVRVFDHFKEGSSHYMVLEYVDGVSLDQLIKKQRALSGELALTIFLDVCRALGYAHGMGVIHRDIKPGNILMSKKGEVKLADFGIATSEEDEDSGLTREGMTLGTPSYMPPEQIENSKNVDRRADIYAMGIMLYEMVTGKKPYPASFSAETLQLIRKGRYRRASSLNAKLPAFVDRLIKKLIQPNPDKRYQDMESVIREVESFLRRYKREPIREALAALMAGSISEEPAYPRAARKRLALPALGLLACLLGAGAYYAFTRGYVYRYVAPKTKGELRIALRVPKTDGASQDILVRGKLFADKGDALPELEDAPLRFSVLGTDEADPLYSFVCKPLYLPPAPYRLKLIVANAVIWESFELPSLAEAGEGLELSYRLEEERPKALAVSLDARDAATGRALDSTVKVLTQGTWLAIDEVPEGWLISGTLRQFRVEAPGYEAQTFSLKLAPGQDRLLLSARLKLK